MPSAKKEKESETSRSSVVMLDMSGRGLRRIEPLPEGLSPQTLLFNNNDISRVENLQYFAHLQQLSLANNRLVEMRGISQAQGLRVLDLSSNSIMTIEGLSHLRSLEWLNLSGNSIKKIENLNKNIHLHHLDLSDNSIVSLADLSMLVKLKTLLLHGNLLPSLRHSNDFLPNSVVTISLAENEISDLAEISFLSYLPALEQLSISSNPCVMTLPNMAEFDYRPYIFCWCPRLRNLDGSLVSTEDRLGTEKIRREGQLRTFTPGRHPQLVMYLSEVTPLRADESAQVEKTGRSEQCTSGVRRAISEISQSSISTPVSVSYEDEKWSKPVLEHNKRSSTAHDVALEDVSESELDDQLESETRYLPILSSSPSPPSPRMKRNASRPHTVPLQPQMSSIEAAGRRALSAPGHTDKPPFVNGTAYGNDTDIQASIEDRETARASQYSPSIEDPDYQDEPDMPMMTEEEAIRLISLAATIIQAHVRGFLVRQKLHFREYRQRNQAATLIQSMWRGYKSRTYNLKVISVRNEIRTRRLMTHINYLANLLKRYREEAESDRHKMVDAIRCVWNELERQNALNRSWQIREQIRAAIKIQRLWRGYRVRKIYPRSKTASYSNYKSLVELCKRLQEQMDDLKSEITELREGETHHEHKSDVHKWSIPEIRVTRPSVCIMPEVMVSCLSGESQGRSSPVLEDSDTVVEIKPLEIGQYGKHDVDQDNYDRNVDVVPQDQDAEMTGDEGIKDEAMIKCDLIKDESYVVLSDGIEETYDLTVTTDGQHTKGASSGIRNQNDEDEDTTIKPETQRIGDVGEPPTEKEETLMTQGIDVSEGNNEMGCSNEASKHDKIYVGKKEYLEEAFQPIQEDLAHQVSSPLVELVELTNSTEYDIDRGSTQPLYTDNASQEDKGPETSSDLRLDSLTDVNQHEILSAKECEGDIASNERPKPIGADRENDDLILSRGKVSDSFPLQAEAVKRTSLKQTHSISETNHDVKGNSIIKSQSHVDAAHSTSGPRNETSKDAKSTVGKPTSEKTSYQSTEPNSSMELPSDVTTSTSNSESPKSPTKVDGVPPRTKKKLLLRSTSADTMPRILKLQSSLSMDSQELSSSLNFSSRLGHRAAIMLSELRSEIANLTARQLPDIDLLENSSRREPAGESDESTDANRAGGMREEKSGVADIQISSFKTTNSSTNPTHASTSNTATVTSTVSATYNNTRSSNKVDDSSSGRGTDSCDSSSSCEVYFGEGASHEDVRSIVPPRSFPMSMATAKDKTGQTGSECFPDTKQGVCKSTGETSQENNRDENESVSETSNRNEKRDTSSGNSASNDSGKMEAAQERSSSRNDPSGSAHDGSNTPRQSYFSMPVFEDIERTSFSLEDFMADSLEEHPLEEHEQYDDSLT